MAVWNATRCRYLGMTVLTLGRHLPRTLRHFNRSGIPGDCALLISPCQGIYTAGMHEPVDIVFLDGEMKILKILRGFPPNCYAAAPRRAVSAMEFPADRLSETETRVGDVLAVDLT